jgi:hypothetical protein
MSACAQRLVHDDRPGSLAGAGAPAKRLQRAGDFHLAESSAGEARASKGLGEVGCLEEGERLRVIGRHRLAHVDDDDAACGGGCRAGMCQIRPGQNGLLASGEHRLTRGHVSPHRYRGGHVSARDEGPTFVVQQIVLG